MLLAELPWLLLLLPRLLLPLRLEPEWPVRVTACVAAIGNMGSIAPDAPDGPSPTEPQLLTELHRDMRLQADELRALLGERPERRADRVLPAATCGGAMVKLREHESAMEGALSKLSELETRERDGEMLEEVDSCATRLSIELECFTACFSRLRADAAGGGRGSRSISQWPRLLRRLEPCIGHGKVGECPVS